MLKTYVRRFATFFAGLSRRSKLSFVGRVLFTGLTFGLMFYLRQDAAINTECFYLAAVCCGIAFTVFGAFAYLTVQTILYVPLVVDLHLVSAYGLSLYAESVRFIALMTDTNKAETLEYLSRLKSPEIVLLALLPVFWAVCAFYTPAIKKRISLYAVAFLVLFLGYPERIVSALIYRSSHNEKELLVAAKNFKFNPNASKAKAETVILLIGETHRRDYFNPVFKQYRSEFQDLYSFNDMITVFPSTMTAVPTILSRKKTNDQNKRYFNEKSVFSLFKEAGYHTYFLHYVNGSRERSFLNFIYDEAENFVKYAPDQTTAPQDSFILPHLRNILENDPAKKLIVIKMLGVHYAFEMRHPPEYDTKKPSVPRIDPTRTGFFQKIKKELLHAGNFLKTLSSDDKERILNSYSNAMDYSVSVIASIMRAVKNNPEPTLFLFSSDHGICLYEKGTFQLPPNCKQAFEIPVLYYLNPPLAKITDAKIKNRLACNTDRALTTEYLFETTASLAGISYPAALTDYDLTKECRPSLQKRRADIINKSKDLGFYDDL